MKTVTMIDKNLWKVGQLEYRVTSVQDAEDVIKHLQGKIDDYRAIQSAMREGREYYERVLFEADRYCRSVNRVPLDEWRKQLESERTDHYINVGKHVVDRMEEES